MAIEKALYAAPQGLEELAQAQPDLEIEIEDPEAVRIGIDGQLGTVKVSPFRMLQHHVLAEIAVPRQVRSSPSLPFPVTSTHDTKRHVIVDDLYHHVIPGELAFKLVV